MFSPSRLAATLKILSQAPHRKRQYELGLVKDIHVLHGGTYGYITYGSKHSSVLCKQHFKIQLKSGQKHTTVKPEAQGKVARADLDPWEKTIIGEGELFLRNSAPGIGLGRVALPERVLHRIVEMCIGPALFVIISNLPVFAKGLECVWSEVS